MIVHVVLFQPRPDLGANARLALLADLREAAAAIDEVRRFRVGRRIQHGLPGYEQAMRENYDYAAIIEFDDVAALAEYLRHPAHAAISHHFTTSAARALAYDFEMNDVAESNLTIAD